MLPEEEESFLSTKTGLLDRICGLLGGRVSEEIIFNEVSTGAHNDFQKATEIARAMVTEYGMSELGPIQYEKRSGSVFLGRDYNVDKAFSDAIALEIDMEIKNIINAQYDRAKQVLSDNLDLVKLIAEYLLEIETLTKEDIYEIVKEGSLSWWEKKKAKSETLDANKDVEITEDAKENTEIEVIKESEND
jgi:cell division protease FtsH